MSKDISLNLIKDLRERSGAGVIACKKALEESNGDIDNALNILRSKGVLKAGEKSSRATNEGIISSYIHQNNRLGSLVEVACETDFVAKTDVFKDLVRNIAIQIVGMNPLYISREDVPSDIISSEEKLILESDDIKNKPEDIKKNILKGRMDKFYSEVCLLDQPYYKDNNINVLSLINEVIIKTGENIKVKKFARFEVGK